MLCAGKIYVRWQVERDRHTQRAGKRSGGKTEQREKAMKSWAWSRHTYTDWETDRDKDTGTGTTQSRQRGHLPARWWATPSGCRFPLTRDSTRWFFTVPRLIMPRERHRQQAIPGWGRRGRCKRATTRSSERGQQQIETEVAWQIVFLATYIFKLKLAVGPVKLPRQQVWERIWRQKCR